jgi:redox-sensitive bicupin YhaK (pirin superfamily)
MSWTPCPDPTPGDRASADAIETLIIPRAVDLGEMVVRRALPSVKRQMVGPFIFFDQMGPAEFLTDQGIDVRPHPHINLATVTFLFEGQILHRDSLGTEMTIEPGAVNWMRAGRGIVHSERTSEERKHSGQRLFGIQSWMALPEAQEESDPAFVHHGAQELPVIESDGIRARVIAGEVLGARSPLITPSRPFTRICSFALEPGCRSSPPSKSAPCTRSKVRSRSPATPSGRASSSFCGRGDQIVVTATSEAEFMLFGGAPMGGPRYIWWNFVSSRVERIEQAKEEWAQGRFDTVPGDAEEFIPLPQTKDKPRRATGGVFYP